MPVPALRQRLARWLPRPIAGPLPLALKRRRIYIVPSRFGLVYGLALFALMLGSLNYNNNAAILLALLLGMAALASAHAAVRFLGQLELTRFDAAPAFAGEAQASTLQVRASGASGLAGRLRLDGEGIAADVEPIDERTAVWRWDWPSTRRGRRPLGRLRLATTWPLGLFYAWTWLQPEAEAVVYPAPESPPSPLPSASGQPGSGRGSQRETGERDTLREFQRGDSLNEIAWKVSARHDRWLVAEAPPTAPQPLLTLSLDQVAHLDAERGLSRLCRWVLDAEARQQPWSLRLPGVDIGPGQGAGQRDQALTALADRP